MATARARLLSQIFATLGVSSVACGGGVVAPDTPENAKEECAADKGPNYAQWPGDKQPDFSAGMNAVCLAKPANGDCGSIAARCVIKAYRCGVHGGGEKVLDSLPSSEAAACCWKVKGMCAVGRPFVVGGKARLAPLARGDAWKMQGLADDKSAELDDRTRAALADVWAHDGLTEHASVASFAQLVLELLAHGAPAELVLGAQAALADEVRHAQRAFALASLYAGHDIAPGPLDTRGAGMNAPDLADFAARTAAEGCIAETIAALQLHAAADAAEDPALAALLRETAEEESAHALLAYRTVAWAIAQDPADAAPVRAAVAQVFAHAAAHVGFGPLADDALDLRAHGILSRQARHDLAVIALRDVVAAAGAALAQIEPARVASA